MPTLKFLINSIRSSLRTLFLIVVTLLITLATPLLTLIITPLILWRKFVGKLASILHPEFGKMVTATGTVLGAEDLYGEDACTIVVTLEIEKPQLDINELKRSVEVNVLSAKCPDSQLPLFPELQQTVQEWMGCLFWTPVEKFNLDDHVTLREFPERHDIKQELLDMTRTRHWVKGKPLWEFFIVNNVTNFSGKENPCSLIYFRMHHVIGDGFSTVQLLATMLGYPNTQKKLVLSSLSKPNSGKEKSKVRKLLENVAFFSKVPFDLAEFLWDVTTWSFPKVPVEKRGQLRSHVSEDVPLAYFKRVKNKLGVDFTTLLLGMITGGIRRRFMKTMEEDKIPKKVTIGFPMLLPMRSDKLRNKVSYSQVNLPVGTPNSIKRIEIISKSTKKLKRSTLPWTFGNGFKMVGIVPLPLLRLAKLKSKPPTFFLTNILGPPEPLTFMGSPLLGLMVGENAPLDGPSGCLFMFMTYNGNARLTTSGLSSQFPNFEETEELSRFCFDELAVLDNFGNECQDETIV